ncbi:MAG: internal scaffolding protein [Microvirus sp.]|nr:MAG: internal scaffolding protein [Microvirus sp.]
MLKIYSRYKTPKHEGEANHEPTMTQQHFANECDINHIMAKFLKTGLLNQIDAGTYDDVYDALDYRESLHIIKYGEEQFATLPSLVRKKFDNDPLQFMEFMHNPNNQTEAENLGLLFHPNLNPQSPKTDENNT